MYFLPDDFSQAKDLTAGHPEEAQQLKDLFWEEAERYKVLPLLAPLASFFGVVPPIPEQTTYEYRGDVQNILPGVIPRIYNGSYTITADLVVPDGGAEGVIVALGRPPWRMHPLRGRWQAHPHLLDDGRLRVLTGRRRRPSFR